MSDKPKVCRRPSDAVDHWRHNVTNQDAFEPGREAFWIVTLNQAREFVRVFEPATRAFGDPQRFADELYSEPFIRYSPQFILIHHRPGVAPTPTTEDIARIRALIVSGREKGIALLDAIIDGQQTENHPAGAFSFRQLANFESAVPFEGKKNPIAVHTAPTPNP